MGTIKSREFAYTQVSRPFISFEFQVRLSVCWQHCYVQLVGRLYSINIYVYICDAREQRLQHSTAIKTIRCLSYFNRT